MIGTGTCHLLVCMILICWGHIGAVDPCQCTATDPFPADGAAGISSPVLLWQPCPSAAGQLIYLGTDPSGMALVGSLPGSQDYYYHQAGLLPAQVYLWRVDTILADGTTVQGRTWRFVSRGLRASNPQPPDGSLNQPQAPVLRWTSGATAALHRLYLGTDRDHVSAADPTWPQLVAVLPTGQTSYQTSVLEAGTTYWWRVDEVQLDGTVHRGPVWSFQTIPQIPMVEDLLLHWTFDEDARPTAVDWSGHGNHGLIHGGHSDAGPLGTAIGFDDAGGYVQAQLQSWPAPNQPFTFTCWIRPLAPTSGQILAHWGTELSGQSSMLVYDGAGIRHSLVGSEYEVAVPGMSGRWTHVALVYLGGASRLLAINGTFLEGRYTGPVMSVSSQGTGLYIGAGPDCGAGQSFVGAIDEIRLYNRTLNSSDLAKLVQTDPHAAWNPSPADGLCIGQGTGISLGWSAGPQAGAHDLYVGTNRQLVEQATDTEFDVYKGRLYQNSYFLDQPLPPGQTVFWRVDEYLQDGRLITGPVWMFTAEGYRVIDDFESYGQKYPDRLFDAWLDGLGYTNPAPGLAGNGTGSIAGHSEPPYIEQLIVHTGRQSMPLYYDNTTWPYRSVVERTFETPADWSGFETLVLYLWADTCNLSPAADRPFVEVQDDAGIKVRAALPSQQAAVAWPHWHRWEIPLAQSQLNRAKVRYLRIGIESNGPIPGQRGLIYLDDIRLWADGP